MAMAVLSNSVLAWCGVCDVSWSLFDASRKKLAQQLPINTTLALLMALQVAIFGALWAAEGFKTPSAGWAYWLPALISIGLNAIGNGLFLQSVRLAPLSLSVPMLSLTPAVAALVSQWWFKEILVTRQWSGIGLIMAGMAWLAFPPASKNTSEKALTPSVLKGLGLMGICAICWAITPVVDKLSVAVATPLFHSVVLCGTLLAVFGSLALPELNQPPASPTEVPLLMRIKGSAGWLLLATAAAIVALYCQLVVTQHMNVGLFEALKRVLCLVGALGFGRWLFKEAITLHKLGVVAVLGAGMALVLL
jgi:drug/metabolite transporter (DMT)-like permease